MAAVSRAQGDVECTLAFSFYFGQRGSVVNAVWVPEIQDMKPVRQDFKKAMQLFHFVASWVSLHEKISQNCAQNP